MTNVFKGDYSVKKVMLLRLYHVKWDRMGPAMSLFGREFIICILSLFSALDTLMCLYSSEVLW